jgi:hypothetical protein
MRCSQAYQAMYTSFKSLWTTSYCDTCPTSVISAVQHSLADLMSCMDETNKTEVCTTCVSALHNVTGQYTSSGTACQNTVDIIDAYRRGLQLWAQQGCPEQIPAKSPVVILFTLVRHSLSFSPSCKQASSIAPIVRQWARP